MFTKTKVKENSLPAIRNARRKFSWLKGNETIQNSDLQQRIKSTGNDKYVNNIF